VSPTEKQMTLQVRYKLSTDIIVFIYFKPLYSYSVKSDIV